MTTISIIAGGLPIALGKGDGSASRAAMTTVVVGGQALCLLLTLVVPPVICTCFDDSQSLRVGKLSKLSNLFWEWLRGIFGRIARPPVERLTAAERPASPATTWGTTSTPWMQRRPPPPSHLTPSRCGKVVWEGPP